MSDAVIGTFDEMCAHSIQLTHAAGKIALWRLNDEAVVIGHLAIGVAAPRGSAHTPHRTSQASAGSRHRQGTWPSVGRH